MKVCNTFVSSQLKLSAGTRSSVRWRTSQHPSHGIRTVTPYRMGCPGRLGQRLGHEIWAIFQGFFWERYIIWLFELFVARYHSTAPVRYSVQPRFYSRFLWEIWFVWHFFDCDTQSLKHMKWMLFLEFQTSFSLLNSDNKHCQRHNRPRNWLCDLN